MICMGHLVLLGSLNLKNSNKLNVTLQTINAYKTLLRKALRTHKIRGQGRQ